MVAGTLRGVKVEFGGEEFRLIAPGGAYWPAQNTLFVADLHFGKAATFRAHSIPAPCGTTRKTLDSVDRLLDESGAERLVVLGDLWHHISGRQPETVRQVLEWRSQKSVEILLVKGNHDRRSGPLEAEFGQEVEEGAELGPFTLLHDPSLASMDKVSLAGHIHPGVRMVGKADQSLTTPCFWIRRHCMVLPALGEFTGMVTVKVRQGERVVAVCGDFAVEPRLMAVG